MAASLTPLAHFGLDWLSISITQKHKQGDELLAKEGGCWGLLLILGCQDAILLGPIDYTSQPSQIDTMGFGPQS